MRFAIVEVKIALAKLLMNYKFTLDTTKTPVPMVYSVDKQILTPEGGVYINFEKI